MFIQVCACVCIGIPVHALWDHELTSGCFPRSFPMLVRERGYLIELSTHGVRGQWVPGNFSSPPIPECPYTPFLGLEL